MFFIFESVILIFSKHANRKIKNIRRFVKTLGRLRMKIQEASGDFTTGGILFPSSEASYLKTKT